jgi:hypothetical protein
MAEQHLQDIELAEKTLEFIGSLRDEDIPSNQHSQMREIGVYIDIQQSCASLYRVEGTHQLFHSVALCEFYLF